jgi:hypothetical protein
MKLGKYDSLAIIQYRDPRMLLELMNRRMVEDISKYLDDYTRSRVEPPSILVTPEELVSYVHLPAGERVDSLTSMTWGTFTRGLTRGQMTEGEKKEETEKRDDKVPITGTMVKLSRVPKIEKVLAESEIEPLAHLASDTVRTFEIVYSSGKTEILLTARTEDGMRRYLDLFDNVYGQLTYENIEDAMPGFLEQLPYMMGLDTCFSQTTDVLGKFLPRY